MRQSHGRPGEATPPAHRRDGVPQWADAAEAALVAGHRRHCTTPESEGLHLHHARRRSEPHRYVGSQARRAR